MEITPTKSYVDHLIATFYNEQAQKLDGVIPKFIVFKDASDAFELAQCVNVVQYENLAFDYPNPLGCNLSFKLNPFAPDRITIS